MNRKLKAALVCIGIVIGTATATNLVLAMNRWQNVMVPVSQGVITVNEVDTPGTYTFSLDKTTVIFAGKSGNVGNPITVTSDPVKITNTGNQTMFGLDVTATGLPAWLTATIDGGHLLAGESGTVTITLSGVPSTAGEYTLTNAVFSILPK